MELRRDLCRGRLGDSSDSKNDDLVGVRGRSRCEEVRKCVLYGNLDYLVASLHVLRTRILAYLCHSEWKTCRSYESPVVGMETKIVFVKTPFMLIEILAVFVENSVRIMDIAGEVWAGAGLHPDLVQVGTGRGRSEPFFG